MKSPRNSVLFNTIDNSNYNNVVIDNGFNKQLLRRIKFMSEEDAKYYFRRDTIRYYVEKINEDLKKLRKYKDEFYSLKEKINETVLDTIWDSIIEQTYILDFLQEIA